MESLKKNAIDYLFLFITILAIACSYEAESARKHKQKAETLENTVSNLNQKLKLSTIQLNDSLSVKQAEVRSLKVTNKNLQSLYSDLLASSKTKAKDIQTLVNVQTTTIGTDTVICLVDSFGGLKAHWKDEYVNILVDIDTARKATIDYSVKDSLTVINYQKKHSILFGLFKWKSYEGCKVITHNPNATPCAAVSYSVINN